MQDVYKRQGYKVVGAAKRFAFFGKSIFHIATYGGVGVRCGYIISVGTEDGRVGAFVHFGASKNGLRRTFYISIVHFFQKVFGILFVLL